MPSSVAKTHSSSLKACPLTREVMKEVIREEEEQGTEMHGVGEFPACVKCYSCEECGNMSTFMRNLNYHKNDVHEDA